MVGPRAALARHTIYNLLGQGLPLLVAVVAVPALIRALGHAAFGVLGLVWMLSGLLGEVGVARAGTRFAAEALGAGERGKVAGTLRVTLLVQLGLGTGLGGTLAVATPWLMDSLFRVAPDLRSEAVASFFILSASTPMLTGGAALRGILEAAQRFGTLNAIRFSGNTLTYLVPLFALTLGCGLQGVVALVLVARIGTVAAFGIAGRDLFLGPSERVDARAVLVFGGWAAVSTIVSPVLVALDRFVLGALGGVAAVGVYTAPYELATRVLLLPGALATTLFPAISALQGAGDVARLQALSRKATWAVAATVGPVALVCVAGAYPLLDLWLGDEFHPAGAVALQILAPGLLANALAQVPFTLIQGMGRADIPAGFHLGELPLHAVITWAMVARWGVAGAAGAWTVRAVTDAVLLCLAARILLRREVTAA